MPRPDNPEAQVFLVSRGQICADNRSQLGTIAKLM